MPVKLFHGATFKGKNALVGTLPDPTPQASGALFIGHTGQTDPETEGWTLSGGTTHESDTYLGKPCRKMTTSASGFMFSSMPPTGWDDYLLTANFATIETTTGYPSIRLNYENVFNRLSLFGPADQVHVTDGVPNVISVTDLDVWHKFQIRRNATDGIVEYWMDGQIISTRTDASDSDTRSLQIHFIPSATIYWGDTTIYPDSFLG